MITYYAVASILGGYLVYSGDSLTLAAEALEPGTCYGKGPERKIAEGQAELSAGRFREILHGGGSAGDGSVV